MELTRSEIAEINRRLYGMYETVVPEYGLRACTMNHLKNNDAIDKHGRVSVGNLNGGAIMKYMTKEVYEFLQRIDDKFGTLIDTTLNGERVKLLVCWRSTDGARSVDGYNRYLFGMDNETYTHRLEKNYTSKRLTWEQFQKWQAKFKFYCPGLCWLRQP